MRSFFDDRKQLSIKPKIVYILCLARLTRLVYKVGNWIFRGTYKNTLYQNLQIGTNLNHRVLQTSAVAIIRMINTFFHSFPTFY